SSSLCRSHAVSISRALILPNKVFRQLSFSSGDAEAPLQRFISEIVIKMRRPWLGQLFRWTPRNNSQKNNIVLILKRFNID
ncbi:MAG: hypothetical protein ABSG40_22845, partial [Terriglobales bacterium]